MIIHIQFSLLYAYIFDILREIDVYIYHHIYICIICIQVYMCTCMHAYITLHYTTLHSAILRYTRLHYATRHYIPFRCIAVHTHVIHMRLFHWIGLQIG